MQFSSYLSSSISKIDRALFETLGVWEKEITTIHPSLTPLARAFAASCRGGKRLRGILVRLGYELAEGKASDEIFKVAAAHEIFHTAILVHDDIIDQSEFRRGKPSLYKVLGGDHYGTSQAISLGDAGFFLAFKMIAESRFSSDVKTKAMQIFADSMLDTSIGEMLDVALPKEKRALKEEDVFAIAKLKTARYSFSGPLVVGAILAGADQRLLSQLAQFGENVGIAYQIQDDILGIFGNENETGKSVCSDISEGKATVLFTHVIKHASKKQIQIMKRCYGKKDDSIVNVGNIQEIFTKTGSLAYAQVKVVEYTKSAKDAITKLSIKENERKILFELSDFLVRRKK